MPDQQDHLLAAQQTTLDAISRAMGRLRHPSLADVYEMNLGEALANLQWCEDRTEEIEAWVEAIHQRRNALVQRIMALCENVESLHGRRPAAVRQEQDRTRPGRRRASQERVRSR